MVSINTSAVWGIKGEVSGFGEGMFGTAGEMPEVPEIVELSALLGSCCEVRNSTASPSIITKPRIARTGDSTVWLEVDLRLLDSAF